MIPLLIGFVFLGVGHSDAAPRSEYRAWSAGIVSADVPSAWKNAPVGKQALSISGPKVRGRFAPGIDARWYGYGKEFQTADDFIDLETGRISPKKDRLARAMGVKLSETRPHVEIRSVSADGKSASRFATTRLLERENDARAPSEESKAIWVHDEQVVLPLSNGFWVFHFSVDELDYKRYLPAFENFLNTLRVGSSKVSKPSTGE
jgi:hypothetical protein